MNTVKDKKRFWQVCTKILCVALIVAFTCLLSACDNEENKTMLEDIQGSAGGAEAVKAKMVGKSCWVCPLFQLAMDTSEQMYKELIPKVASGAVPVLGVIFGLWLAVRTLKLVGSMAEPEIPAYWKDVGTRLFWTAMGAAMLYNIMWVVDFIQGLFTGFVDFGVAVVTTLPIPGGNISCPQGDPKSSFICLLTAMQEKLNVGQDVSLLAIVFGNFTAIVIGVGGYVMSIVMGLYFPILLMDGVFRMGLVMAFLPLGVVGLCFPFLSQYAGKLVSALMSIGLQIVGLSIFIAMAAGVLYKYIEDFVPEVKEWSTFLNNALLLNEFFDGSPGVFGFIFVCAFLLLFAGVIMDIMATFGGLSPSNMVGGAVMAMRNVAKRAQQIATFASNRASRARDNDAKKTIEAAKRGENVDKAKLEKAKSRMEDRGYMKRDDQGNLKETEAYQNLNKGGARAFLGNIATDMQVSGGNQTMNRAGDKNKIVDD